MQFTYGKYFFFFKVKNFGQYYRDQASDFLPALNFLIYTQDKIFKLNICKYIPP